MRIVVFSDSHRNYAVLQEIIRRHPEAETFIHLGDGEWEFQELAREAPAHVLMLSVRGNNDFGSTTQINGCLRVGKTKILYTHGHLYFVQRGLLELENFARASKADIMLYGHTHQAAVLYRDGVHFLNPGSVSQPRDGSPSYGIVDLTGQGIACHIVRRDLLGGWGT